MENVNSIIDPSVVEARPKILIVDDRLENLVALERIIADLAIDPIRAMTGNQALALSLEHDFALALVDVQLPEMDGFEMVELLHQQKKTALLPVIFVSAVFSGEYYKLKGVEVGAIDFIEKPIVPELLRGKVRIFLQLFEYQRLQQKLNEQMKLDAETLNAELIKSKQLLEEENQKYEQVLDSLNGALKDLEKTNNLKKLVRLMSGRENRMAELKNDIIRLNTELDKFREK